MIKRLIFLFLVFLLAGCSAGQKPSPTPAVDVNTEEQAVYMAVLAKLYGARSYVFEADTATDPGGVTNTAERIEYVMKNLHGVDQATVDSFRDRNTEAHALSTEMNIGASYVVLSQEQRSQIFSQNQNGWDFFYKNYPDAPGITGISRVGFNKDLSQAMVYVGTESNFLAGAGYFVLLNKVNGTWTVDQQVMTWIS